MSGGQKFAEKKVNLLYTSQKLSNWNMNGDFFSVLYEKVKAMNMGQIKTKSNYNLKLKGLNKK